MSKEYAKNMPDEQSHSNQSLNMLTKQYSKIIADIYIDIDVKTFNLTCKDTIYRLIELILKYKDKAKLKYIHLIFLLGYYNSDYFFDLVINLYEKLCSHNIKKQRGCKKYMDELKYEISKVQDHLRIMKDIFLNIRNIFICLINLKTNINVCCHITTLMKRIITCEEYILKEEIYIQQLLDFLSNINNQVCVRTIVDKNIVRINDQQTQIKLFKIFRE